MDVIATAGHVDHGKSTLVRGLTGIEPDRWEQERRRGLTIDLGYAWTELPGGRTVAFVDVPGHRRFIGNMLAGLGPAPAVMFVVAADEGWRPQSAEHLAACDALALRHGLLVVTRADLAGPERTAGTLADARSRLARSSLGEVRAVACSARTGAGLDDVRAGLAALIEDLPRPDPAARLRMWIDRSFTIKGAGTVVTGTLAEGAVAVGDDLVLATATDGPRRVRVRGLQALERHRDRVEPTARVAVNLRGVDAGEVRRGDALLAPAAWRLADALDVRLSRPASDLPERITLHVGTAALPVRVRPLADRAARLTLPRPLPLTVGDRALLRDPGAGSGPDVAAEAITGLLVVDADPPELRRRGAGARRGATVAAAPARLDLVAEVARRGHLAVADAVGLGLPDAPEPPEGVRRVADRYVATGTWATWVDALRTAVAARAASHPLDPRLTFEAARAAVGLPDLRLVPEVARAAGLDSAGGRVALPDQGTDLGPAEAGLRRIEDRLTATPFVAPEAAELAEAGLGPRELAAAARVGRLLRLPGDVVLRPVAPAQAMRVLAGVPQPFTLSEARVALGTTRRVAVPLLEHLDARGWTRRVDGQRREVVR
ncbi:MAG: selenocysteine-specific translation elongation factor [Austwickia sp.]|jgi:selenocysteine-specific elongation factor|nr:MAG: selenocysteine-specific translation elongation factor [Austwickia sp.]